MDLAGFAHDSDFHYTPTPRLSDGNHQYQCYACESEGRSSVYADHGSLWYHVRDEHDDTYSRIDMARFSSASYGAVFPKVHNPISPADDWHLQKGDIHYARNFRDFQSFHPVEKVGFAETSHGLRPVLGSGTFRLPVRLSADTPADSYIELDDVHYIPDAPGNGVSLQRLQMADIFIRPTDQETFELYRVNCPSLSVVCCGSSIGSTQIICPPRTEPRKHAETSFSRTVGSKGNTIKEHFTKTANLDLDFYHCERPRFSSIVEYPAKDSRSAYFASRDEPKVIHAFPAVDKSAKYDDNDWPAKEFWPKYTEDPERREWEADRKAAREHEEETRKRRRLEQSEEEKTIQPDQNAALLQQQLLQAREEFRRVPRAARDQLQDTKEAAEEILRSIRHEADLAAKRDERLLQQPTCNDWLIHKGNVAFCRDRSMFDDATFHPISTTAMSADGNVPLRVLGVGDVYICPRRQFGQHHAPPLRIAGVLFIPAAKCNGVGLQRFQHIGWELKRKENSNRVSVINMQTHAPVFCANSSSGRDKICMKDEDDGGGAPGHLTFKTKMSISADREMICAGIWIHALMIISSSTPVRRG